MSVAAWMETIGLGLAVGALLVLIDRLLLGPIRPNQKLRRRPK